ncbi:MAG: sigma 54-interacting transcriptional regulator [Acidobacteria bacterium]|nr:sigma 54-interacting transcriptional regulator [Acidobacteriota bacterium]
MSALAADLELRRDATALRARLEEGLRRVLPAAHVRLRDLPATGPVLANVGEPSSPAASRADPSGAGGSRPELDDWQLQLLQGGACLGALIAEIDRAHNGHQLALARHRRDGAAPLIGSSAKMHKLRERIERVAGTDFTVLIEGESGSGKELVAHQIHDLGRRRRGPFVAVNCAALVESLLEAELFGIEDRTATGVRGRRGKFESADGGTLFLDEVSDLSPAAQAKLLRALQELSVERVGGHTSRRVDTRIVAATNRSLARLVETASFRADLYYRLNGVEIRVPPLRARRDDIAELAEYFLQRHRSVRRLRLSSAALDALKTYDWPGNVRELERVMERAVTLAKSDQITLDDLPACVSGEYADVLLPSLTHAETMRAWGTRYARLVLERCANNKRRTCEALGISYHTLQAYLRYEPRAKPSPIAAHSDPRKGRARRTRGSKPGTRGQGDETERETGPDRTDGGPGPKTGAEAESNSGTRDVREVESRASKGICPQQCGQ